MTSGAKPNISLGNQSSVLWLAFKRGQNLVLPSDEFTQLFVGHPRKFARITAFNRGRRGSGLTPC
jgi:hypothetical protein